MNLKDELKEILQIQIFLDNKTHRIQGELTKIQSLQEKLRKRIGEVQKEIPIKDYEI
jgi:hypothetical protein